MFTYSEATINQALALLIEDDNEKIPSFGRTQSSSPATRVYWTVAFKAFEQALPTFILLTQFKSLKDIRDNPDHGLEKALAILLAATIFSGLNVVWMDWNKLQYRSTPEFDLYWLTKDVEIKPHALYFYLQDDVLHYLIQKDEETLEIKSLNGLDSTTADLIKERKFHELTAAQCDLLKQAVDKYHKPGLKMILVLGENAKVQLQENRFIRLIITHKKLSWLIKKGCVNNYLIKKTVAAR